MAAQTEFPMFCERQNSKHRHIVANFGKKHLCDFALGGPRGATMVGAERKYGIFGVFYTLYTQVLAAFI
jgi:hypothetical protein